MKKPLIGITLDQEVNSEKYSYSDFPWYALRKNYSDVYQFGGIPIFIPHEKELMPDFVDMIDGIIFTGGDADIDPALYGQEIKSPAVRVNKVRSNFEIELCKLVLEKDIPFLGICNGMQVLNVALGGTMIQDIKTFYKTDINHEQPKPKNVPTHDVLIIEGTKLRDIAGTDKVKVNSTHHQALDKVAPGLMISAKAPDGIIEAVEMQDREFVIGVEWHPEYLETKPLDENLFKELIKYARRYKDRRSSK